MSTPELTCTACGDVIATEEIHDADLFRCDLCLEKGQVAFCPCGKSFSRPEWVALKLVGHQSYFDSSGAESATRVLELRNCSCGSTRTIVVPKPAAGGNPNLEKKAKRAKKEQPRGTPAFVLDFDRGCNRVQLHGLITRAGREATTQALCDLYYALKEALREDESALVVILQADEFKLWVRRADSLPMSAAAEGYAVDMIRAAVMELGFSFA